MATPTTATLSGLGEIAGAYDGFILDVWGTVYDGAEAFPGVVEALATLREQGRRVSFLSNSPQLPPVVARRMDAIGIASTCYDCIVTSGGETNRQLRARADGGGSPDMAVFAGLAYETGPDRFPDTLPRDRYQVTDDIERADWILNAGPNLPPETVEDYAERLEGAAKRHLPMLCANPDNRVFHGTEVHVCAGALADHYAALGGTVHAIGKPHGAVFERCREELGLGAGARLLMVGDNLETDVLGANRAGIDALLIASGVHDLMSGETTVDAQRLANLQDQFAARADYVVSKLCW